MGQTINTPATLPADFGGWDAPAILPQDFGDWDAPQNLPADFNEWDGPVSGNVAEDRSTGFLNNLQSPIKSIRKDSLPAHILKYVLHGPTPEQTVNHVKVSISKELSQMETDGLQDTPEYQQLTQDFDAQSEIDNAPKPEFNLDALKEAVVNDPGGTAAQLANAIMADPELLLSPVGWERAAAMATARLAKSGKALQEIGSATAGITGAAATGAAIQAPISAAAQLAESGSVDPSQMGSEMAMAATAAPILVAPLKIAANAFRGVSSGARGYSATEMGIASPQSIGAASVLAESPVISFPGADVTKGAINAIIDVTGGKAISPVRRAGEYAPSIKKIADSIEAPEDGATAIGATHHERVSERTGHFITSMQAALLPVTRAVLGGIKRDAEKEIVAALRGGTIRGDLAPAVAQIRAILDDVVKYANKAGMTVNRLENYFPRIYNKRLLETDGGRSGFIGVLTKHGVDASVADEIVQKITNNGGILDFEHGGLKKIDWDDPDAVKAAYFRGKSKDRIGGKGGGVRAKNLETNRKLRDIPDEELAPFLESGLYPVLTRYIENAVKRAEWVRSFGKEGGKLNNLVRKGITEARQSGKALDRATVNRIYDLADALQGNFRRIDSRPIKTANTLMGAYQLMRTMPLATISSLSEPLVTLLRTDAKYAIAAIPKTIVSLSNMLVRGVYKKFPKDEATRALEELGLGLDAAVSERLTAAYGGEVTQATSAFFKATLLHDWTKLNRILGNETGKNMVIGHLKGLARGADGAKKTRYESELRELGIDINKGVKWFMDGASKNDPFFKNVKNAGLRFTDSVVMNPRASNRPMWHSNPHLHLVAQLKSFQTVFGNTVVKRIFTELTQRGAYRSAIQAYRAAYVISLMLLTANFGNHLRERIKYGPEGNPNTKNESSQRTLLRALDRTGLTGIFQFALDATLAHRFGSSGLAALGGPAMSQAEELMEAAGVYIETGKTSKLRREAANAVPIANTSRGFRDYVIGQ